MKKVKSIKKTNDGFEFYFKLFVAGEEPNSNKAIEVIKSFCRNYLSNKYELEIIDVYEDYQSAIENKIIVIPTLIIRSVKITTTIIGSLDNPEELAKTLGLI